MLAFLSLILFSLVMGQSAPRINIPTKVANHPAGCILSCVNVRT
jgi:hypothetical protein